jgi:hypothetical protein
MVMEDQFKDVDSLHYSAPMLTSYNQKEGTFQQVLAPEPIQIKVDSGTDPWIVAIGLGSILSSMVIAYFSFRAQKNQIKANISNLRHHWMNEVRSCSSEMVQIFSALINELATNKGFRSNPRYQELIDRGLMLQIKLNLLLTKDAPLARGIIDSSGEILIDIRKLQAGTSPVFMFARLGQLEDMLKDQLENAWRDIKLDYGVKTE